MTHPNQRAIDELRAVQNEIELVGEGLRLQDRAQLARNRGIEFCKARIAALESEAEPAPAVPTTSGNLRNLAMKAHDAEVIWKGTTCCEIGDDAVQRDRFVIAAQTLIAAALQSEPAVPPPEPVATDADVEAWRKDFEEVLLARCDDADDGRLPEVYYKMLGRGVCLMERTTPPQPSSGNQRALEEMRSLRDAIPMALGLPTWSGRVIKSEIDRRIAALQAAAVEEWNTVEPAAPVPQPQKPEATRAVLERLMGQVGDHFTAASFATSIKAELAKLDKPAPLQADAAGTAEPDTEVDSLMQCEFDDEAFPLRVVQAIDSLDDRVRRLEGR